jgi:hypothetical protein
MRGRRWWRRPVVGALVGMAAWAGSALAVAPPRVMTRVAQDASIPGLTADGSRILDARTVPGLDMDPGIDVFKMPVTGPLVVLTPNTVQNINFVGEAGGAVVGVTSEALDPIGDTNADLDAYLFDGVSNPTRLTSATGLPPVSGASFCQISSSDAGHVLFTSPDPLDPLADTDTALDVYERRPGVGLAPPTFVLRSPDGAPIDADCFGATADLSKVAIMTAQALPGDLDTGVDVYLSLPTGDFEPMSPGDSGTDAPVVPRQLSADGSQLLFSTTDVVPGTTGDTDATPDIYLRRAKAQYELVTQGTAQAVTFRAASDDLSRVQFRSEENLTGVGDLTALDEYLYQHVPPASSSLTLLTPGTAELPATSSIFPARVGLATPYRINTAEALTPGDTDAFTDSYLVTSGVPALKTPGTQNGDALWVGDVTNPARSLMLTSESFPGTGDTDTKEDLYERDATGAFRLVTAGTYGASATGIVAGVDIYTPDGRSLFVTAAKRLDPSDTDDAVDLYRIDFGPPFVETPSGTSGDTAVNGIRTCQPAVAVADGIMTTALQWLRDGVPIPGQTGPTLTLTNADVGHTVACRTSFTNVAGSVASISPPFSGALAIITVTTPTQVSGGHRSGDTVSCSPAVATSFVPIAIATSWLRDGQPVPGAGTSITLTDPDFGHQFVCRSTLTAPGGNGVAVSSDSSPFTVLRALPRLSARTTTFGGTTVGTSRTCLAATAQLGLDTTITTAWLRNGTPIPGATGTTYVLTAGDAGATVLCRTYLTLSDGGQTVSDGDAIVVRATVTGVQITKATAKKKLTTATVGATVRCRATVIGAVSIRYTWLRGAKPIARATKQTYKLSQADRGKRVRCRVTATNPGGDTVASAPVLTVR